MLPYSGVMLMRGDVRRGNEWWIFQAVLNEESWRPKLSFLVSMYVITEENV
jgi:hypothetical protein